MSTGVSAVYDKMNAVLTAVFVTPFVATADAGKYKKLSNAFVPELNDDLTLRRGYAFYMGPKNVMSKPGSSEGFEAQIIFTQTILKRGTDKDFTINENAEKNLLEDQFLLIDYFRQNTSYGEKIWDIRFSNDNGLEFVFAEKQSYVMIKTTFTVKFSETC